MAEVLMAMMCLMGMFFVMKMAMVMMWSHRRGPRGFRHRGHGPGRGRSQGRGRGGRGRWWAHAGGEMLKRRLDLDEDQSDLADHAVADIRRSVRDLMGSFRDSRGELAEALRDPTIDDARLEVVFDKLDEELKRTRREVVSAVKQVHGVLDDDQREHAAEWLSGARWA